MSAVTDRLTPADQDAIARILLAARQRLAARQAAAQQDGAGQDDRDDTG